MRGVTCLLVYLFTCLLVYFSNTWLATPMAWFTCLLFGLACFGQCSRVLYLLTSLPTPIPCFTCLVILVASFSSVAAAVRWFSAVCGASM